MRNTLGNDVTVTLFGESHGKIIGAVLDGMPSGIEIDYAFLDAQMERRKPKTENDTKRREKDEYRIVSGIYEGRTTGAPVCVLIPNGDVKSADYDTDIPRPNHADYTAFVKYGGFADMRGGGHFSGRLTAPLTLVGGIALIALKTQGITVRSTLISPSEAEITAAKKDNDSIGGLIKTEVYGVPVGAGEPFFDGLESVISHAVFSIPAVKGIEFGGGFTLASARGSEVRDEMRFENGKLVHTANNMGGIIGGISNGKAIVFTTAIKPTPSIAKECKTVNLITHENVGYTVSGRHDTCIATRVPPVLEGLTAISLCDMLSGGGLWNTDV